MSTRPSGGSCRSSLWHSHWRPRLTSLRSASHCMHLLSHRDTRLSVAGHTLRRRMSRTHRVAVWHARHPALVWKWLGGARHHVDHCDSDNDDRNIISGSLVDDIGESGSSTIGSRRKSSGVMRSQSHARCREWKSTVLGQPASTRATCNAHDNRSGAKAIA